MKNENLKIIVKYIFSKKVSEMRPDSVYRDVSWCRLYISMKNENLKIIVKDIFSKKVSEMWLDYLI